MKKRKINVVNLICALSLLISILIISVLIYADVSVDDNAGSEGNIQVSNVENHNTASASDASKEWEGLNGNESTVKLENPNNEKLIKIENSDIAGGKTKDSAEPRVADEYFEDKSLDDELATDSDALERDGLFDFETFGDDRANVDSSPNVWWSGEDGKEEVYIGEGESQRNKARKAFIIDRDIDYYNHTITWRVIIQNPMGEDWRYKGWYRNDNTEVHLFLPRHIGDVDIYKENDDGTHNPLRPSKIGRNKEGSSEEREWWNRWYHKVRTIASTKYTSEYIHNVSSDLNWFDDDKYLTLAYEDNNVTIRQGRSITYTITTRHSENENLDKVLLGAMIGTRALTNKDLLYMFKGQFGAARRAEFEIPEDPIVVRDKEHLTQEEREEVKKAVLKAIYKHYASAGPNGFKKEKEELKEAENSNNITVSEKGEFFAKFDDNTVAKIVDPTKIEKYIVQGDYNPPIITPNPEETTSLDTENIPEISVNVVDREDHLQEIQVRNLPQGLNYTIDSNTNNRERNIKITGKVDGIVWTNGETHKEYTVTIYAKDSWNNESQKNVKINIERDMSLVPVGTNESGYKLPLILISLSFISFMYIFMNMLKEEV